MTAAGTIRLEIGNAMRGWVLNSEFGVWTEDAARMHVALLHPENVYTVGLGTIAVVRADAEAWDVLRRWCEARSFTPPGANPGQRQTAASYLRQERRLRRELDHLGKHPGFRGVAVPGTDTTILLGKRCEPGRWWPTVRQAMDATDERDLEVAELRPTEVYNRGQVFTTWQPADVPASR